MKKLLFLLCLLISQRVVASPCSPPTFYDGYSGAFPTATTISGFIYGLDESYLYVTLPNGNLIAFINVPQQLVVNRLIASTAPDMFFAQNILYIYKRPLFTANCQNLVTASGKYLVL